jgi:hypothetical protein
MQQLSEAAAFPFCAAAAQVASFMASLSGEAFPHSPAASTCPATITNTSLSQRSIWLLFRDNNSETIKIKMVEINEIR